MVGNDNPIESYPTEKRGFHIAHLNVQSINNTLDLVKIQVQQMNFQVFSMSETWLTVDMPDNFLSIDGYNIVRYDRGWMENHGNGIKRGGGSSPLYQG